MRLFSRHILGQGCSQWTQGAIHVEDDRIVNIEPLDELPKYVAKSDSLLADYSLLPGFVNAHCHLELTSIGSLPRDSLKNQNHKINFVSWIKELVRRKEKLSQDEQDRGIKLGAKQLLQSGVTTLGDHMSINTNWRTITETPLRGCIFGEVLGIVPEVCEHIYTLFKKVQQEFSASRFRLHISPHSVHALALPVLLKLLQNESPPLSIHLSESLEEKEYFGQQGGDLLKLIHDLGVMAPHHATSGLEMLAAERIDLSKILLVHGNYLGEKEIALIKRNNICIVHCPGSHAYFEHQSFPLEKCLDQNITVALGTDSLTSNFELNFLSEIRRVQKNFPQLGENQILKMATINGAKALCMENEVGTLERGKKADIVGFKMQKNTTPFATILKKNAADLVMIDGKIEKHI